MSLLVKLSTFLSMSNMTLNACNLLAETVTISIARGDTLINDLFLSCK